MFTIVHISEDTLVITARNGQRAVVSSATFALLVGQRWILDAYWRSRVQPERDREGRMRMLPFAPIAQLVARP